MKLEVEAVAYPAAGGAKTVTLTITGEQLKEYAEDLLADKFEGKYTYTKVKSIKLGTLTEFD